ncbi:YggS family pyridoxal phosphate-dependent enzyme [Wenzhouxiangella marina]|uniref:Pyridoxal phosphate homeostasis protein n=1 Tax=Wenzhouxiangella marina TaxID=1579979 RepID=A0A0K0XZH3_9GAMM|nr:YggS family pyridoxal phosphate-dependent enzyme [Wenzhouxiangella marina]AKS43070.1 hypothetical protein WM2015_2712 [Wenzhouxiangella marina]MBB6087246.1 hypothetical protein [Wenzhouxiangella marina]
MYTPNQNPSERLDAVRQRIHLACERANRSPEGVRLLAVSKTQAPEKIRALVHLGQKCFGENYVDEAVAKIEALADLGLTWHFIGPVQSNKTRAIAEHFDWVESVDRAKIVRRLADQRPADRGALNVLIQVNLDGETQKAGCAPEEIEALAEAIEARPELRLRGLMAIPAPRDGDDEQRAVFARLKHLFDRLAERHASVDTISAGMSGDLEAAIAEGSTQLRVGTDLFGPRS